MAIVKAILLEPIKKLGKPGDIVPVRRGYFRYLEMLNKVRYATKEAILHLEEEREVLKLKDEERKKEAEVWAERLTEKKLVITSEAGERGTLYGSISARDIAKLFSQDENVVLPNQVLLANPIKEVGLYPIVVELHPQVIVTVEVEIKSATV